ncbi:Ldh family oxidoreductase [Salinibacterium sp. ZJ70]|uniref:Ldh family oxidoreductase n=1 Tax=Salinibacterium sp. ZJ70 TaxID=2708084 RepID=UPI0014238FE6|nr:Ldh family oxidoreductase [Salinibacterium sp. ZJ70]
MQTTIDNLRARLERAFLGIGAPTEQAIATAEMCLDAELREHFSHGVRLVRNIATEYRTGASRRRELAITSETPVSAIVDGGYNLSPYVHRIAADLAAEKADTTGIGIASVHSAGVSGALGYLVERIAARGFIAIAFNSTPLVVVAPGTTVPTLGTNPLAMAVPREDDDPLVLDMSTSSIAFNKVMRARSLNTELPAGVALDVHGEVTRDPHAAVDAQGRGRLLPFGGHRGYGLSLMLELIVSGFITGRTGATKRGDVIHEPDDFGALYLAIDPAILGPAENSEAVECLIAEITAAGGRLPGENSRAIREERILSGVVELDAEAGAVLAEHTP